MTIDEIFDTAPDLDSSNGKGMPNDYKGAWASWYFPNKTDYQGGLAVNWRSDGTCTIAMWTKADYLIEMLDATDENKIKAWAWFKSKMVGV